MKTSDIPPFAITAKTYGQPAKLYTPLLVVNLNELKVARVNAMWDTGSPWCLMSKRLADILKLDFTHSSDIRGIAGTGKADCGLIHVSLVSGGGLISVETAIVDNFIGEDHYSFIIGLNLIRQGSFALTSNALETTLTFKIPAETPAIDFVVCESQQAKASLPLSKGVECIEEYNAIETVQLLKSLYPKYVL